MRPIRSGGGSYTVASENLGERAGLLAAAALMIDYVLTAAVGISAGVGALISAVPSLQPHTLELCLVVLVILTLVNMRGVHDTGVVFMIPTYLFTGTLLIVIAVGAWQAVHAAGHPQPVTPLPAMPPATANAELVADAEGFFFGLHGDGGRGSGEQWRDGVSRRHAQERQDDADHHHCVCWPFCCWGLRCFAAPTAWAQQTRSAPHYESVLSMLTRAVMGHGWFYYLTIGSVLLVLALSANTAFADFPRLTRAIAGNNYCPMCFCFAGGGCSTPGASMCWWR